jgi:NarL family two-component system sensor histidine kinase LiaS
VAQYEKRGSWRPFEREDTMIGNIRRRFRGLRGRLTLSYFVTAFVTLMLLDIVFVLVPDVIGAHLSQRPPELLRGLEALAPQAAPYLARTPVDQAGLDAWLRADKDSITLPSGLLANSTHSVVVTPGRNSALYVLGPDGQLLTARLPSQGGVVNLSGSEATPEARAAITAALGGHANVSDLFSKTRNGHTILAAPITDTAGHVLGALVLAVDLPTLERSVITSGLIAGLETVIPFALLASVIGTIFGLLTARGLITRLGGLTAAADSWSQGDFAVSADDPVNDELGQLARDLNRMAEELQTLLHSRQQLAVVEERQRLARDLHDSVKQQIFAASMQIAAARALARTDAEKTESRLAESERLIGTAQKELNALIRELRPAALGDKGLAAALRELCAEWSGASGIAAEVRTQGERATPLEIEQALFRVAQEALSNVARHSGATTADLRLAWEDARLTLTIADNGRGFDVAERVGAGYGLGNMRERIESLGGDLRLSSGLNGSGGTVLEARVPVEGTEPKAYSRAGAEKESDT